MIGPTPSRTTQIRVLCILSLLSPLFVLGCAGQSGHMVKKSRSRPGVFAPIMDRLAASRDKVASRHSESSEVADSAVNKPADARASQFRLVGYEGNAESNAGDDTSAERRVVIYNAAFRVVVPEIEASIKKAEALAAELKGWVQGIEGDSISVRVPAARFHDAVSRVEGMGRVAHREVKAADVTEEYVDLEARLKNARAVRERLLALLEKAEDVKAALEVEKELMRVGEEIERIEAKLALLKNRVAYSTISITFERVYRAAPTPQLMKLPFQWLKELDPARLTMDY